MAVTKKEPKAKAKSKEQTASKPTESEIQAAFDANREEVAKREAAKKKRDEVLERTKKEEEKVLPKRIDQVLKNDLVTVEVIDRKLPLDPVPLSAVAIDGLMEFAVHGTHLRLLAMIDPSETPNLQQRIAMAKRLNEVGPYLPRYIKHVSLKDGRGLSAEEVKESEDRAAAIKEGRERSAAANSTTEPTEQTGRVRQRRERRQSPSGTPKATASSSITNGVPLKKICAAINVDPKIARRVLRAKGGKPGGRWEWPEAEVEAIKKIIADGAKELTK